MTEKPELQQEAAQTGLANAVVLGVAAYMIFPILALVTAVLGLILILNDRLVPGMVFLAIIMQLWVAGGLWAHFRRRKILSNAASLVARQAAEKD